MTTIRELDPADWRSFRAVRLAALADSPSAFGSALAGAEQRTDSEWKAMVRTRCTSEWSAIWVAESEDGHVVAVVAADRGQNIDETELVSMWVAPVARGSALGRRLIDTLVAWAAAGESTSVALWVMRGNALAHRLYESAGFVVADHHQALSNDPCKDEIRMVRPI